jgi:hypothetical protein
VCDNDINEISFVFNIKNAKRFQKYNTSWMDSEGSEINEKRGCCSKRAKFGKDEWRISTKTYECGSIMKYTTSEASEWLVFALINKLILIQPKVETIEIEGVMEFNLGSLTFLKNSSNLLSFSLTILPWLRSFGKVFFLV